MFPSDSISADLVEKEQTNDPWDVPKESFFNEVDVPKESKTADGSTHFMIATINPV